MKMKSFLLAVSLITFSIAAFSQSPLSINKISTSDAKHFIYIASYPINVKGSASSMMLAPRFASDNETGTYSGMSGVQMFAKGLGKCFYRDTLLLFFKGGKKLKLTATSPQFCDQQLSAWFDMNKDQMALLSSLPLVQVRFTNSKTGEHFRQDVTEVYQQEYFIEIKRLNDKLLAEQSKK